MELISIGKFAKIVGVTPHTLRDMHRSGELIPCHVSQGGTRYYSTDQLKYFTHSNSDVKPVIGYCRVSTASQKDDLAAFVQSDINSCDSITVDIYLVMVRERRQ